MITIDQIQGLLEHGGDVRNRDGSKIGGIGQVFLDDSSGNPEWVTVSTGLFGSSESFIPLADSSVDGNDILVPYDKSKVKDAPRIENSDEHLSEDQERELYRYYGLKHEGTGVGGGRTDTGRGEGRDTSGPTTDDAMTRSEEQLRVGKEQRATGKARLRKYVVTENVTQTVPVSHEEVRIEREPITDENIGDATDGPAISEEEHEVTLTEERPVVEKEVHPVERVRMGTETVTENEQVSEQVRKEKIEADRGDAGRASGNNKH